MSRVRYLLGVGVALVVLDWVDLSTSDVANQATLLVLVVGAGLLGFTRPAWAWLAGLALGSVLAVTHVIYLVARHPLPYPMHPSGWAGPITLLALLVPALLAAYAGAGVATLAHRRPRSL